MARTERVLHEAGVIKRERVLPLAGNLLVEEGQVVEPGTLLAETEIIPGDPYVIDVASRLKMKSIDPDLMSRVLLKDVGDRVNRGEIVARHQHGALTGTVEVESPVDGVVEFVSAARGRILVREEAKSARPVEVVNVARQLEVWPALVRMHMRYKEGDEVRQGSILAASPGAMSMDYVYAPVGGIIERIDAHTGNVYIVRPTKITQVTAYIPGVVESVVPERGGIVRGTGLTINGVYGVGGEAWGQLVVPVSAPDQVLEENQLTAEHGGSVVVAGALVTAGVLDRAREIGVAGLIAGGIHQGDMVRWVGQEMTGTVTGEEDADLTLVLIEGFGRMPLQGHLFSLLRQFEGKMASLNGRTQVRAGAIRPEVIISLTDGEARDVTRGSIMGGELEVGLTVRILRGPYFGRWGQVIGMPDEPVAMESEAVLPVARVKLDTGEETVVARDNLEIYSGTE